MPDLRRGIVGAASSLPGYDIDWHCGKQRGNAPEGKVPPMWGRLFVDGFAEGAVTHLESFDVRQKFIFVVWRD